MASQINLKYQHLELTKKISMLNIINREETEKCDMFTKHKAEANKVKRDLQKAKDDLTALWQNHRKSSRKSMRIKDRRSINKNSGYNY